MTWWLWLALLVILLIWCSRLVTAVKQRSLTKELHALLRRISAMMPDVFSPQQEKISAAELAFTAASSGLSAVFTPGTCLQTNLAAARAAILPIETAINRLAPGETATLTALLDSEQQLLARNNAAFLNEPGSYACRHIRNPPYPPMSDAQIKKLIPQIEFHTKGNRAYSRHWCRQCLIGFEDQWGIAVSGGH